MSVGSCSNFGQGAELVGFGLLLSTSFVERNFLLEEGFPSEDGNRFCHVIFFTFAGNLFLERVYLCKDVQSKEIGVEKEMRQCGTKGLSG